MKNQFEHDFCFYLVRHQMTVVGFFTRREEHQIMWKEVGMAHVIHQMAE